MYHNWVIKSAKLSTLSLHPTTFDHAINFLECLVPEVSARFTHIPKQNSIQMERDWISRMNQSDTDYIFTVIYQNRVVGVTGIHNINHSNNSARLGILLHPDVKRQGIGREVLRCLIDNLFKDSLRTIPGHAGSLELNKVILRYRPDNIAMDRIAEILKFKHEGFFFEDYKDQSGKLHDMNQVCLTRKMWQSFKEKPQDA